MGPIHSSNGVSQDSNAVRLHVQAVHLLATLRGEVIGGTRPR